jgi:hypothetical protein
MQQAEARIGLLEFVKRVCVACLDWTGPLAADYEHVLYQLDLSFFYAGLGRLQDATREHAQLRRAHADTLWLRSGGANVWTGM